MFWMLGNTFRIVILVSVIALFGYTNSVADDFTKGIKALDDGQDAMAIRFFSSYLSRRPESYEAYLNRGTAFVRSGFIYQAISDWSKAAEMAPLYAFALYTDDVIRVVSPKNSQVKFVAMIELFPERAVSVVMAGATYLDLGLNSKAIDLFRMSTILTKNPLFKTDLEYWIKTLDPGQKTE